MAITYENRKNVLSSFRILNVLTACLYVYLSFRIFPAPGEGFYFILAVACTLMAGNVLNDYFDTETDRINKPGRSTLISLLGPKETRRIYYGLCIVALINAIFYGSLYSFFIVLIANLLLALYAWLGKKAGIAGNILVAFLSALSVFSPYLLYTEYFAWDDKWYFLYDDRSLPLLLCTLLAFFFSLLREWIKDMEDIEGDRAAGLRTGVIQAGLPAAVWIARVWSLLYMAALCILLLKLEEKAVPLTWLCLFAPVCIVLWGGKEKLHFKIASALLKVVFLSGILAYFFL